MSITDFNDILHIYNLMQVPLGIRSLQTGSIRLKELLHTCQNMVNGKVLISVLKGHSGGAWKSAAKASSWPHAIASFDCLLKGIHGVTVGCTPKKWCSCLKKQQRAWLRDSNPAYFLTSAYMANRCVRWACLSGCWCQKITKIVKHS